MIIDEDDFYDEEGFSEIETFDAFMDMVNSHPNKRKPSEIEAYINNCKAFFRAVYNLGIEDGFFLAEESKNNIDKI